MTGVWKTSRLKYGARLNPPVPSRVRSLADELVSFVPMEAIGEDWSVDISRRRPVHELLTGYSYFEDGDLLMAKVTPCFENGKATIATGLTRGSGFGTTEVTVVRATRFDPRFLFYVINEDGFRQRGVADMTGAGGLKRVPDSTVRDFRVPHPQIHEQREIVEFLDRETGEIDAFNRDQEELIELLKERRAATISHAVTEGLDSEVPLHPSGTPWWGNIPHHWRLSPIKQAARLLAGFPFASDKFVHSLESISLLRGINVGIGSIDWAERVGWSIESGALYGDYELRTGDLVLGLDRPIISRGVRLARVAEHDLPALLLQRVARVRASSAAINDYLEFALQGPEFRRYMEPLFTGVSVPHLSVDQLGAFPIPLPPVSEQAAISKYLRHELELIDESISDAVAAVALSQERRSALISAVVTGKIDVREPVGV